MKFERQPTISEVKQSRMAEMMAKVKQEAEVREKRAKKQRLGRVGYSFAQRAGKA